MIKRFDDGWDYDLIDSLIPDGSEMVIIQIERYIAGQTKFVYDCAMPDYFIEWLDQYVQCSDCKNGCSMDDDPADKKFIIEGSNWYNELLGISGTDSITIRVRKACRNPTFNEERWEYNLQELKDIWEQSAQ